MGNVTPGPSLASSASLPSKTADKEQPYCIALQPYSPTRRRSEDYPSQESGGRTRKTDRRFLHGPPSTDQVAAMRRRGVYRIRLLRVKLHCILVVLDVFPRRSMFHGQRASHQQRGTYQPKKRAGRIRNLCGPKLVRNLAEREDGVPHWWQCPSGLGIPGSRPLAP